ncbi:hypothetical protein [Deinococcus fonticola]|nr:hypothetical protein [Deinococcus fonticola]
MPDSLKHMHEWTQELKARQAAEVEEAARAEPHLSHWEPGD